MARRSKTRPKYSKYSKILSENKVKSYIIDLVKYVGDLSITPELGKSFININGIEYRQLIFKIHRIFYYIKNEKVIVVKIIHKARNIDNIANILFSNE